MTGDCCIFKCLDGETPFANSSGAKWTGPQLIFVNLTVHVSHQTYSLLRMLLIGASLLQSIFLLKKWEPSEWEQTWERDKRNCLFAQYLWEMEHWNEDRRGNKNIITAPMLLVAVKQSWVVQVLKRFKRNIAKSTPFQNNYWKYLANTANENTGKPLYTRGITPDSFHRALQRDISCVDNWIF